MALEGCTPLGHSSLCSQTLCDPLYPPLNLSCARELLGQVVEMGVLGDVEGLGQEGPRLLGSGS